ncbi:MAG: deoxynucleoside kinase [Flavobacteriales bacterium]
MKIIVEGNIGSGKTTLAKKLANHFALEYIPERFEHITLLNDFYQGKQVALELELAFLKERYRQFSQLKAKENYIADHSFFRSLIFAKVNLSSQEYPIFKKEYDKLSEDIPLPERLIYIDSSVEELLLSINRRGRSIENQISEEYLRRVNQSYAFFFKKYPIFNLLILQHNSSVSEVVMGLSRK